MIELRVKMQSMAKVLLLALLTIGLVIQVSAKPASILSSECPGGWYDDKDNQICYIDTNQVHDREDADFVCQSQYNNSTLPMIPNAFVNSLLYKDTQGLMWLGMECSSVKKCEWYDGSPLTYTNWDAGYPSAKHDFCFYMSLNGRWRNGDCSAPMMTVCEKPGSASKIIRKSKKIQ